MGGEMGGISPFSAICFVSPFSCFSVLMKEY